ncbi:MAG: hypothetical protein WCB02_36865 [Bradyrhizobium sp.]
MRKLETADVPVGDGRVVAVGAADWLSLAAAPTFAIMALVTHGLGGPPDLLCAAAAGPWPLSGMVPMYVLMSAFHLAPWMRLISDLRDCGWRAPLRSANCRTP